MGPNELLHEVWGYRSPGDHAVVTTMIRRLRDRLTTAGAPDLLTTGAHGTWRVNPAPSPPPP